MYQWFALYAKPHKERQVSRFLESKGYQVYLPAITVRKRGQERVIPFFSCYLFVRMKDTRDFSPVRWTPGLRAIVSFGGQPGIVPDDVISLIRQRLAQMQEGSYPTHPFEPGDRVTIKSGPLADMEAVFEEGLSSRDRARILVSCLGRWTRCEVEIGCLQKVR